MWTERINVIKIGFWTTGEIVEFELEATEEVEMLADFWILFADLATSGREFEGVIVVGGGTSSSSFFFLGSLDLSKNK